MELFGGGEAEVAHLRDGRDASHSRGALGHHEHPDGLDGAVLGLARSRCPARQRSPGGLDGVERVGLAVIAPGLAVGPVYLDDFDAASPQEPAEPSSIGSRPFDADLGHLSEGLEPAEQRLVAGDIGTERLGSD
jgi:hypothetical protein